MRGQKQLLIKLKKQRDLLNELIIRIDAAHELHGVSQFYDDATKQIEKNLKNLRRSLLTQN